MYIQVNEKKYVQDVRFLPVSAIISNVAYIVFGWMIKNVCK
jgi:hypothetical protein